MCGPAKLDIRYVVMYIVVIFLLDKHKMIFTQQWENYGSPGGSLQLFIFTFQLFILVF